MSKSSVVWDYFTLNNDQVKCGLCKLIMKHNRSSTSNMMRHLRIKHTTINLNRRQLLEIDDPESAISNSTIVSTYI